MNIHDFIKKSAASEIFSVMSSEEKSSAAIEEIKSLSDQELDLMGTLSGVPESQLPIYRAIMRGEENDFFEKLGAFEYELKTGDIILVTGKSAKAKILANSQRTFYFKARSSHVAIVHADFICIDAMPIEGVSNRLISEILSDVEANWRIIRFLELEDDKSELIQKSCAHYIEQPYKITLKRKRGKNYSYCSELARKVFADAGIEDTGIPSHRVIKPCDFDKIADSSNVWCDITEKVRPYIDFAIEYAPLLKVHSKLFIEGLLLNRKRYEERREWKKMINSYEKKKKISPIKAQELRDYIKDIESKMSFNFWDSSHTGTKTKGTKQDIHKTSNL